MTFRIKEVIAIQELLIKEFGGLDGMRDQSRLEAALSRPFQTFDGQELYPTRAEKAAAILESIVINHPFVDGNKRIGYVLMRLILLEGGEDIEATQDEKYVMVIDVAKGEMGYEEIVSWINEKKK